MRISVIGTGYLGTTHAACMAEIGHDVIGIDVDEIRVKWLADGRLPFYEPELEDLLGRQLDSGRLRFSTSYADAAEAELHFLCLPTPQQAGSNAADLAYVTAAVEALAPLLTGPAVVVGKSTVPVGTAREVAARCRALAPSADVEVAWNPEFLREGHAVQDTLSPDRIVIGVEGPGAEAVLREAYAPLLANGVPLIVADLPTAELVKVSANSFLATKISFINAMAELCEVAGGDVEVLAQALALDPRIGGRFLRPGLGFGGGCLPKDIRAFMHRAGELGASEAVSFLREVDAINQRRRTRTVDLALGMLEGVFAHRKIAVLGAAFKPDSDDIRDSPALEVASSMHARGAEVVVTDPRALDNARRMFPNLTYASTVDDAVVDADLVMLLTEWPEYQSLSPTELGSVVRHRNLVDGRNVLDPLRWRAAGWTYRALGRP